MAVISKPNTFSAGGSIIASEHNSNFDTIYNEFNGSITNANISGSAAIADTKLDQISTASKVAGDALTDLANIPSGAGLIPAVNLAALYPIGIIYTSTVSTNPGTLFGFGTWTAFGAGRVLVGLNSGDTDFDTVEETGGAKTHTLTTSEIPSHAHSVTVPTINNNSGAGTSNVAVEGQAASNDSIALTSGNAGSGGAHNNLQPYIVVYFFKRTA